MANLEHSNEVVRSAQDAGIGQVPEHLSRMQAEVQQAGQVGSASTGVSGARGLDDGGAGSSRAASHLPSLDLVGHGDDSKPGAPGGGGCFGGGAEAPIPLGRPGAPSPSGGFAETSGTAGGSDGVSGRGIAAGSSSAHRAEMPVNNYRHN